MSEKQLPKLAKAMMLMIGMTTFALGWGFAYWLLPASFLPFSALLFGIGAQCAVLACVATLLQAILEGRDAH